MKRERCGYLLRGVSSRTPVYKGALRTGGFAALVTMIHASSNVVAEQRGRKSKRFERFERFERFDRSGVTHPWP
jgi:hypothetical protein